MAVSAAKLPRIATRAEWRAARIALLAKEKEMTRALDALSADRRSLPMVPVEKAYSFEGRSGASSLLDIFDGHAQLIVYHFMYHMDQGEGCSGCSHLVDNMPHLAHLHARDTALVLVSRAPHQDLETFRRRMGWNVPWYSSYGSDFNYDFHATSDESVAPVEYNYRGADELREAGHTYNLEGEQHGLSVFVRDGDRIYHTYSTYARGVDILLASHQYLDLTPSGRGEGWGGTPNLGGKGMGWLKHHDRYDEVPVALSRSSGVQRDAAS